MFTPIPHTYDDIAAAFRRSFAGAVGMYVHGVFTHTGRGDERPLRGTVEAVCPGGLLVRVHGGYRVYISWIDLYANGFVIRPLCDLHPLWIRAQRALRIVPADAPPASARQPATP